MFASSRGSMARFLLLVLLSARAHATVLLPPVLDRLAAGAIMPEGWLLDQAHIQAAGLTGGAASWPGVGINTGRYMPTGGGNTGEEQGGEYYINGMYPLTCQIDIPELRDIRERSVHKILHQTGRNGTIGGDIAWAATPSRQDSYWGSMIAILALETYVECVGPYAPNTNQTEAVETALLKHYSHMRDQVAAKMPPLELDTWGTARYQEVLLGVQWLVDRGHSDAFLFELMELVRGVGVRVMDWEGWFTSGDPFADKTTDTIRCWGNKSDPTFKEMMIHHGVNIMEAIKTGPAYWRISGNETDRDNAVVALDWIDKYARSADGTMTAPDCLNSVVAGHDPMSGIETCSVVESMFSLRTAYEITGSIPLYDRMEHIAFNSLPDTTDELFGGNCYYHSVNQNLMSGKYGFEINGCCTGNIHQGWPKFIMAQTQTKHGDVNAIVVSGYAPHKAALSDGTSVSVGGQYPYADGATVSVKRAAGGSGAWSISLRIPCWAASATVAVEGGASYVATPCSLFAVPEIEATATGLSLTVTFKSTVQVIRGQWRNGAAEVHRGPLVFAFPVPGVVDRSVMNSTSWSMVTKTSVSRDGGKATMIALRPNATEMTFGGFSPMASVPFARAHPPATLKVPACPITDAAGKGRIPSSPVPLSKCTGDVATVELVPLSHTYLRLTALPTLADAYM